MPENYLALSREDRRLQQGCKLRGKLARRAEVNALRKEIP
jgi:hypothetical protein